jgi:molybdate transport system substrate-binding protein
MKRVLLLAVLLLSARAAFAEEVLVAAASDLSFPIKELVAGFEKGTGHKVKLTLGSSGTFQAQIVNGAPFDVFMSADVDYIHQLDAQKLIEPGSSYTYATGRIVVWVPNASPIDLQKLGMAALTQPGVKKIAIANPEHAPYGRAAIAAMQHYRVYDDAKPRLVMGENIAQAAQFVSSGAADVGVIALSLALSDPMKSSGRYWLVPLDAYPRMEQALAILSQARKAGHLAAAKAFRDWIASSASTAVLQKYGFSVAAAP